MDFLFLLGIYEIFKNPSFVRMDFGGLIVSLKYLQLCFKDERKFGT